VPWHGQRATNRLSHGTANMQQTACAMARPKCNKPPEPWHGQHATNRVCHGTANVQQTA